MDQNSQLKHEVSEAMERSSDELLRELGAPLQMGIGPIDAVAALHAGKEWLTSKEQAIRNYLCNDELLNRIKDSDNLEVAQIIADILLKQFGLVPASRVAVIVARRGLIAWCGSTA